MRITKKEVQTGLNQLVGIKFLQVNNGRYKFHPNYKKILLKSKGENREEVLLDALVRVGFFLTPKTEREVFVILNLLLLKKDGSR